MSEAVTGTVTGTVTGAVTGAVAYPVGCIVDERVGMGQAGMVVRTFVRAAGPGWVETASGLRYDALTGMGTDNDRAAMRYRSITLRG